MPEAFFSEEWGSIKWGEGLPAGPITDIAGNTLVLPDATQFLGYSGTVDTSLLRDRIYSFHLRGIRQSDRKTLFWKRFCDGPEREWERIEATIDNLSSLFNVDTIADEFLPYLAHKVGWNNELSHITAKLTANELRQLVSVSVPLWKRRGVTGGYIEILNAVIGVDAWEWDWFDRRFLMDTARLGEDMQGSDAYFMTADGRRETNLRLADPKRALDRELVTDLVKLWRPCGERVNITFVEFFDRFNGDTKGWKTYNAEVETTNDITSGVLVLDDAGVQHAFPQADPLPLLSSFMFHARLRWVDDSSWFGVAFRHDGDFTKTVELRIDPAANTMEFYKDGVQFESTIDLHHDHGFILAASTWLTLRVVIEAVTDTNDRLQVYLDNEKITELETTQLREFGVPGVCHGAGTTLDCDSFEIIPVPGENIFVGINGQTTR